MTFHYRMLIAGEWTDAGERHPVRNPFDGEVLGDLPQADADMVETAIAAVWEGRKEMAALPAHRRAGILHRAATLVQENHKALTTRIVLEAGKAWKWAATEVDRAVENLIFAADEARRMHGETVPMDASAGSETRMGFWFREPIGLVGAISPFNFPLNLLVHKMAPAVAAGNAVIAKPASNTAGPAQLFFELLLEAGVPPAGLALLYGSGRTVGEAIVRDERVGKVTFTGSVPVGKRITTLTGPKKVTLELGSNSGTIVDENADIDLAVKRNLMGAFAFSGQVCISVQRIFLHKAIAAEFTEKFVAGTQALNIGDPMDPHTDVGPMISLEEAQRAEQWVKDARKAGATVLTGGERRDGLLQPTVLADVTPDMDVMCSEVFAPIVSLVTCDSFEEAVRMCDDSRFGLQAGVFTRDIDRAFQAIRGINVGGVIVNDVPTYRVDHMPYGGNKDSGVGREGARFAVEDMTTLKMVVFNV